MEESELRRGQNTLFILGGGVITFGVWSVVKMIMYFALDPVVGLDVGLRFYVGLSARAEARGKKKSRAYIVVAALMAAGNLLIFLGALLLAASVSGAAPDNILDTAVSTIVDITAQITLIELVLTARRVQRLRKLLSV